MPPTPKHVESVRSLGSILVLSFKTALGNQSQELCLQALVANDKADMTYCGAVRLEARVLVPTLVVTLDERVVDRPSFRSKCVKDRLGSGISRARGGWTKRSKVPKPSG
jgi:hypothetical protein